MFERNFETLSINILFVMVVYGDTEWITVSMTYKVDYSVHDV
jgi:hypothetical protein